VFLFLYKAAFYQDSEMCQKGQKSHLLPQIFSVPSPVPPISVVGGRVAHQRLSADAADRGVLGKVFFFIFFFQKNFIFLGEFRPYLKFPKK
jgi:hypothetical protein